ncbi:MAG: sensor domain-containing diguanylate cyclase [Candidatus Omnitrophota bacterium]
MPKNTLGKHPALKITGYVIFLLFIYFLLPFYSVSRLGFLGLAILFLFYLINIAVGAAIFKRYSARIYSLDSLIQGLREKLNLLSIEYCKIQEINIALNEKHNRYNSLRGFLEKINQSLDLGKVADIIASGVFSLIGNRKCVCLLYLVDPQTQKLSLFKAKKEEPGLIIKSKEGSILDLWVLKHASPLLIEDIKNDFRFDLEKLKLQDPRDFSSLISAPFIVENKFLGIIRLDNKQAGFFTQDDLRFLVSISDLGKLALESSELFRKTQDLAIHDSLTLLYTKGYFSERLKEEFKRCLRQAMPFSVLMLDIDFFKNYNDKFGHAAGDIVLKEISRIIRESLSKFNAIISRFGGEEFCVGLSGMDKHGACDVAEALRERIGEEKIILRRTVSHVSVSIGVANFPADVTEEDELIRASDKALYKAKEKGRNRVCHI